MEQAVVARKRRRVVKPGAFLDIALDPPVTHKSIDGLWTLTAVGSTLSGNSQITAAERVNPVNTVVFFDSFIGLMVNP